MTSILGRSTFAALLLLFATAAIAQPLRLETVEAEIGYDSRSGQPLVTIRLSEASRVAFADFTAQHVGKQIDLRIDGKSVMKTFIRETITGGVCQIIAPNDDEARRLTGRLIAKAPLEVEPVAP